MSIRIDRGVLKSIIASDLEREGRFVSEASYIVYPDVPANPSMYYAKNGRTGLIEFSGKDATDVIQAVIDALKDGGRIFVDRGFYKLSRSITLKPGISIEGVFPRRKNVEPNAPEWGVIEGGTVFVGDGTFPAFTGNNLVGVYLRNLGFKNFSYGLLFGDTNVLGIAFSRLENLYFDNTTVSAIKLINFQHIRMSHIKAILPSSSGRFLHFVNDHYNWAGGNSVIDDVYSVGGAGVDGVILFEQINRTLNLIEVIRPQVNMWNSGGVGSGIKLKGTSVPCSRINLYGVDVEGGPEAAVKLEYAQNNFIEIAFTDAVYAVYAYSKSRDNVIISPRYAKLNVSPWENIFIGGYLASLTGGVYGLAYKQIWTGDFRPVISIGNKQIEFHETRGINTPGTIRVQQKGVNIKVPAGSTSLQVTLPVPEPDTNYGVLVVPQWNTTVWVTNKTTTGFTINFGTAPTTDNALDWFVYR